MVFFNFGMVDPLDWASGFALIGMAMGTRLQFESTMTITTSKHSTPSVHCLHLAFWAGEVKFFN